MIVAKDHVDRNPLAIPALHTEAERSDTSFVGHGVAGPSAGALVPDVEAQTARFDRNARIADYDPMPSGEFVMLEPAERVRATAWVVLNWMALVRVP